MWKKFWKLPIPHKVRIFAGKVIQGGLATEKNRRGRHIIRDAACDICGMEEESEFHGTVSCQHARSLRSAMREHWLLPEEKYLVHTGPEWLLHIVSLSEPDSAARLILTMWRAWFVRDRWTHFR